MVRTRYLLVLTGWLLGNVPVCAEEKAGVADFQRTIRPLLENYCYDCHADGANKGNVAFDEFASDSAALERHDLWLQVLKNLRAGLMPPARKAQPTAAEKAQVEHWIKHSVFGIDPANPDPGRVTLRRLNRVEYENTIRDLLDVEFNTSTVFPPDDSGHGFDNIGAVLTLPPMLLEKYVTAADEIIARAVPTVSHTVREQVIPGGQFRGAEDNRDRNRSRRPLVLSYYEPNVVSNSFKASIAGQYRIAVALMATEHYVDGAQDENKCRLTFAVDGTELLRADYERTSGQVYHHEYEVNWPAGERELRFELQPLTTNLPQTRSLGLQITSVKIIGPLAREHWVAARDYKRYFPKPIPAEVTAQREYARELLHKFARRAYRRPPDAATLDRLVALAESVYQQPGTSFESGVAQAMVAVLASPRFLFREEWPETAGNGTPYPRVDEFSLASRLSYFLWSSQPDEELLRAAETGTLRENLEAQVKRMLADSRAEAFVQNFVGQWLHARDIEKVAIEPRSVLAREGDLRREAEQSRRRQRQLENKDQRTPEERAELSQLNTQLKSLEMSPELRLAMRLETEKSFEYLLKEDRSLIELLDADYAFLNEPLAVHYNIPDVTGDKMRLVKLPANSPRGGILTQGTFLGVTSNPTRTSPVKRGVFILENILGTPPPPPPPDIPPLEEAAKAVAKANPTLRETLAAHREESLCRSCHNRMDPLGLALENFNAMGMWRDAEQGQPIDATGELLTGEKFSDVRQLKRILVENHSREFYRTIAEKLLVYALGRGLEYYDVETVDQIVARLEAANGRPSVLIAGIIDSAPFQKMRPDNSSKPTKPEPSRQRADAETKQRL